MNKFRAGFQVDIECEACSLNIHSPHYLLCMAQEFWIIFCHVCAVVVDLFPVVPGAKYRYNTSMPRAAPGRVTVASLANSPPTSYETPPI